MTDTVLDRLIAVETRLVAALDAGDVEAIEAVLPDFAASVVALKPLPWADMPHAKARVREALTIADSARVRVRLLADHNQQRMDLLAAAAGRFDCTPATYSRAG
jgi:hypothetical protein